MSSSAIEAPPTCMRDGCSGEGGEVCKGCGVAAYCSLEHSLEHWKFHAEECNIQQVIGEQQVPWLVEEELSDPDGNKSYEVVPVYYSIEGQASDVDDAPPMFVTSDILAKHYNATAFPDFDQMIGEQTPSSPPENIGAPSVRTTVRTGAVKHRGVPCGAVPNDVNASIKLRVVPKGFSHENPPATEVTYLFHARDLSKHRCVNRSGVSFKLTREFLTSTRHLDNMKGFLHALTESGTLEVTIAYGAKQWSVSGDYNIPGMLPKSTKRRGMSFATRFRYAVEELSASARKELTNTSIYRLKAKTANNVTAVLFLHRGQSSHRGGSPLYNLTQLEVHVPQEAINNPEPNVGQTVTLPAHLIPGEYASEDDLTRSRIDSEFRPDVVALYDCIQDIRDEMRKTYDEAQSNMDVGADERDKIHRQLTDISRVCSLIGTHAETLEKEERGDIEPENISTETEQAIADALQYIEENIFTRTSGRGARAFRDWRAIRKHRRDIKKMDKDDLLRMFVDTVSKWESSLQKNTEDTLSREMARAEQEAIKTDSRFRALSSRQDFKDANTKFMTLVHQGASVRKRKLATRKAIAKGGPDADGGDA